MNTPLIKILQTNRLHTSRLQANRFQTRQLVNIALVVMAILLAPVSAIAAQLVDINNADAATMIENWKGIGETKAKAIVAYRKKNGKFKDINDLANVKGIGEGLIKNNRKYMSVSKGLSKPSGKTSTAKKSTTKKSTTKKSTDSSSSKKTTAKKDSTKKSSSSKKSTSKKSTAKKSKSKKCKKGDKNCKPAKKSSKKKKKKNSTT